MSDPATLAFYEEQARAYVAHWSDDPSRDLATFLDRLEPGARILELGCGGGRDSAYMVSRGFVVDPTDGTAAMVDVATIRFGLPARQMRFDEITAIAEYGAVWANACLLHVARTDVPEVLAAIHRSLRPGGWHYANFKLGDGEGRDPLGRLTNFPDETWLEATYRAAGFAIEDGRRYRGEGCDGVVRDWYALTLRKPA